MDSPFDFKFSFDRRKNNLNLVETAAFYTALIKLLRSKGGGDFSEVKFIGAKKSIPISDAVLGSDALLEAELRNLIFEKLKGEINKSVKVNGVSPEEATISYGYQIGFEFLSQGQSTIVMHANLSCSPVGSIGFGSKQVSKPKPSSLTQASAIALFMDLVELVKPIHACIRPSSSRFNATAFGKMKVYFQQGFVTYFKYGAATEKLPSVLENYRVEEVDSGRVYTLDVDDFASTESVFESNIDTLLETMRLFKPLGVDLYSAKPRK